MTSLQNALEAFCNAMIAAKDAYCVYMAHGSSVSADALREAVKRVEIAGEHLSDLLVEEHE